MGILLRRLFVFAFVIPVVRKNQAIGRQLGHKRMNLVNEFRKESSEQLRTSFKGRSSRKQLRRSISEGSEGNNIMRKNIRLSLS